MDDRWFNRHSPSCFPRQAYPMPSVLHPQEAILEMEKMGITDPAGRGLGKKAVYLTLKVKGSP